MFIDDLTEHEVGLLILALKYWRAQRLDTPTRRSDPVVTPYGIDLLIAKLQQRGADPSVPQEFDDVRNLFHR